MIPNSNQKTHPRSNFLKSFWVPFSKLPQGGPRTPTIMTKVQKNTIFVLFFQNVPQYGLIRFNSFFNIVSGFVSCCLCVFSVSTPTWSMNKTFAVSTTRWFLDRSQDDSSTFDSVTLPGLAKPMAEPEVADVEKSGILGILCILQVF